MEDKKPNIAGRKSMRLELQPGVYWWCACGHSSNAPFCDGSHVDYGFEPIEFEVTETKEYKLCQCKHTKAPPFCDHTHRELPE